MVAWFEDGHRDVDIEVSVARRRIQGLVIGVLGMDPVGDGSKSFRSRRVESREEKRVFSDERIGVGRARRG